MPLTAFLWGVGSIEEYQLTVLPSVCAAQGHRALAQTNERRKPQSPVYNGWASCCHCQQSHERDACLPPHRRSLLLLAVFRSWRCDVVVILAGFERFERFMRCQCVTVNATPGAAPACRLPFVEVRCWRDMQLGYPTLCYTLAIESRY